MHYTIDGSLILNNQKIIENFQTNNINSAPSNTSSTPANNTSSTPANNTSSTPANINYSTDNNIDIYKLSDEINNINNILQSTVKRDELSKLNQDLVNLYNMINNNKVSETVKKEELTAFGNNILNIVDTNIKNITNQIQYQQKEIQNKFAKIQDTMEKLKLLFSDSSFSLKDQILSSSSIEIKK